MVKQLAGARVWPRRHMSKGFDRRFDALIAADGSVLVGGLKGVEKESLRVDVDGYL